MNIPGIIKPLSGESCCRRDYNVCSLAKNKEENQIMKYQIEDYQKIGKKLKERLELETEIVAIKFVKNLSEFQEGFIRPLQDLGKPMPLCMAMAASRYEKQKMAMSAHDNSCTPVTFAHGWAKVSLYPFIKSQVTNDWNKNTISVLRRLLSYNGLGLKVQKAMWPLNKLFLRHRGFMTAPLSETPFIPDTVVIYCVPGQMVFIANAFCYESKYIPRSVHTGYGEACFAAALFPLTLKRPVVVNLGAGARAFSRVKPNEEAIGMPASFAFYLDEYLFKPGAKNDGTTVSELIKNPPAEVDEDTLPGWRHIRNIMKYYK
jgi:uncharacterized protein (DUF169 family)